MRASVLTGPGVTIKSRSAVLFPVEEETTARAISELIQLGLVERGARGLETSRRWKAAMMRASAALRDEEARQGVIPGNPLVNAVTRALADLGVVDENGRTGDYVAFLVALELSSFPSAARAALGFD